MGMCAHGCRPPWLLTTETQRGLRVSTQVLEYQSERVSIFMFLGAAGSGKQRLGQQHRRDTVRKQRGEE